MLKVPLFLFVVIIFIFFMDFIFSIESSRLVCDLSSSSVREAHKVSGISSFDWFFNDLYPEENGGMCDGKALIFLESKIISPNLELDPSLLETYLVILYFFFFFWNAFSGVTIALVSPVIP